MKEGKPRAIHLSDYAAPEFRIGTVDLRFELHEHRTVVRSRLEIKRQVAGVGPLVLHGQDMELLSLRLDGEPLGPERYRVEPERLIIDRPPERFVLECETRIDPGANTALEGLYLSSGNFCTQCEAEGFRRITYYLDRPDVMARFSTTIVADAGRYPVLLSNGNLVASEELPDGRHSVTWEDPFPKPCYLFALVAGDLGCVRDVYRTASGRDIDLRIYVEHPNLDKCDHAMASLKAAMRWDEEVYGLEYDLDVYMIVAVSDFNMGAMENKGLNVFNTRYVLARGDTATDQDYRGVESVIAHEYFHNWTGNRVTCRDWFQLSLKEGLTVFRDQEFSADMGSRAVKRIADVRMLRASQFLEDSGPMAHPVRPDSYIEINNFYTTTVYNKGAEVIRMMHTLLGVPGFRRGMDLYFDRHDGQAVTCDDFVNAMESANGVDLGQFRRWYSQAGTPELRVTGHYDADDRCYSLQVQQSTPPTPGQPHKEPLHIPLAVGLVGQEGGDVPLQLEGETDGPDQTTRVLSLHEDSHTFRFVNVPERPVPSLLRGFSAPVKLSFDYSDDDLAFLLANDSDPFNRWEAGQRLSIRVILDLEARHRAGEAMSLPPVLAEAFRQVLSDHSLDGELRALLLTLPAESYLAEFVQVVDPIAIHEARRFVGEALAGELGAELLACREAHRSTGAYDIGAASIARRSLANVCLAYLSLGQDSEALPRLRRQFLEADNMTDSLAALTLLADREACQDREDSLAEFHNRWRDDALVLDKWFTIQAISSASDTAVRVESLLAHPDFSIRNPNKVRALIGAFCAGNPYRFHDPSGRGYGFLADRVAELNALNPQIAARLVQPLTHWRRYDPDRGRLMRGQLENLMTVADLSPDVYEVVSKSLAES